MRKLLDKPCTWYSFDADGHAVIYAIRKGGTKREAAFTCHASCIPLIQQAGTFNLDCVVLRPVAEAKP